MLSKCKKNLTIEWLNTKLDLDKKFAEFKQEKHAILLIVAIGKGGFHTWGFYRSTIKFVRVDTDFELTK